MNVIKHPTIEQIDIKDAYATKWIAAANTADAVTQQEAETIVNALRARLDVEAKPVIVVDNPLEMYIVCRLQLLHVPVDQLLEKMHAVLDGDRTYAHDMDRGMSVRDRRRPQSRGVHHAASMCYVDTIINGLGMRVNSKRTEDFNIWTQTARFWDVQLFEDCSVVCRKPVEMHRDAEGVITRKDGPAIVFGGRGDFKINVVNGRQVV